MKKKTMRPRGASEHLALDKDDDKEFETGIEVKKSQKKEVHQEDKRGVVLLSHIPYGFHEEQMFKFFSQFGEVTRLKLIRSKKTGRSKHVAFIEFQYEEVAKIAAETMDNYLMFQKILKCKLLPLDDVKPFTFKNWQRKFHLPTTRRKAIKRHNKKTDDPEKIAKRLAGLKAKREALQEKLHNLGIDYDVMNIKVNNSFIPPERPRASPEEVAKATRNIFETTGKSQSKKECTSDKRAGDEGDETKNCGDEDVGEEERKTSGINAKKGSCSKDQSSDPSNKVSGDEHEKDSMLQDEIKPSDDKGGKLRAKKTPKRNKRTKKVEPSGETDENVNKESADFDVMVVDLDDSEITFKSPPAEARIRRKSVGVSFKEMLKTGDADALDRGISGKLDVDETEKKKSQANKRRKSEKVKLLSSEDDITNKEAENDNFRKPDVKSKKKKLVEEDTLGPPLSSGVKINRKARKSGKTSMSRHKKINQTM